jgi:hypothetical protein
MFEEFCLVGYSAIKFKSTDVSEEHNTYCMVSYPRRQKLFIVIAVRISDPTLSHLFIVSSLSSGSLFASFMSCLFALIILSLLFHFVPSFSFCV